MWEDDLSYREIKYTKEVLSRLQSIDWAQSLLKRIQENGGICQQNKPLLFEARYAVELSKSDKEVVYEYSTGVGASSCDFRIKSSPSWLVELVSLQESQAAKKATKSSGQFSAQVLSSDNDDRRQSEDGEYIKAQERICEKVISKNEPIKFPVPTNDTFHMVVVDIRGFNGGESDAHDYKHLTHGASAVGHNPVLVRYWNGKPILGLFEKDNPLAGAAFIQERVHFLCFLKEEEYVNGELPRIAYYLRNPHLIESDDIAKQILGKYPLYSDSTSHDLI